MEICHRVNRFLSIIKLNYKINSTYLDCNQAKSDKGFLMLISNIATAVT